MTTQTVKNRFLDGKKWIRILYVALFAAILPFLHLLLGIVTLVQIILTLFNEKPNSYLQDFGRSFAVFYQQVVEFQLWVADHKPFPFDHWPAVANTQATASAAAETVKKKAPAKAKAKAASVKKASPKKTVAKKTAAKKTTPAPSKASTATNEQAQKASNESTE